jgi:hypothetical protein
MFKSSMIKMTHGSSDIDNSLGELLLLRAEGEDAALLLALG